MTHPLQHTVAVALILTHGSILQVGPDWQTQQNILTISLQMFTRKYSIYDHN
mgnify:CR=1 FL=1